jgi:pimeloyl-ACP methyl ester carboxylesterase
MINKKICIYCGYFIIFICCIIDVSLYSRTKNKKSEEGLTFYDLQNQESLCRGPLSPTCFASAPVHVNEYGDILETCVPSSQGPVLEKIMLHSKVCSGSKKHITRTGFLTRYKNAEATILICHGFMCDKFDSGLLRALFPRGKFNFMTFDFRAHGDCPEGQFCTLGRDERYDVVAAARFLKGHKDLVGKPIIVYGFSMGAVAAIEAQAKDSSLFDAMILDCPFESTENVLKRSLDKMKFSLFGYEFSLPGRSLLQRYAFHPYVQSLVKIVLKTIAQWDTKNIDVTAYPINPAESVKKISVPVFYILCKNDEKVSVDAIKSLYQSTASVYKQLWITNGRRHFDSYFYNPEQYTDRVRQFVLNHLKGTTRKLLKNEIIIDNDQYANTLVPFEEKEGLL